MQATVWQDHFLKERNMHVPIMRRSVRNMEYYMGKEPGGTFVALDKGKIVGSIISHTWGKVGWFGPLEVNPVCQGRGYGKALAARSVEYLRDRGCTTIGCETMASSPSNIAFYMKQGFRAKSLSHVFYKPLANIPPEAGGDDRIRQFVGKDAAAFREAWNLILPGLDYSSEIASLSIHALGECFVMETGNGPAHAIVHTYEMFDDSQNAIIKLLVAGRPDSDAASILLKRCELAAANAGKTGMFIRTYDANPPDLGWFLSQGYALQGNSVRLILEGQDETDAAIHVSCWSA